LQAFQKLDKQVTEFEIETYADAFIRLTSEEHKKEVEKFKKLASFHEMAENYIWLQAEIHKFYSKK